MVSTRAGGKHEKDLGNIEEDIIASITETYDLGSEEFKWNYLWVAIAMVTSLVIGGAISLSNIDGTLFINATTEINGSLTINENLTVQNITVNYVEILNDLDVDGNVEIHGNLTVLGSEIILNVSHLEVNGSFLPALDGWFNLGSPSLRWEDLYLSGDLILNGTFYGAWNSSSDYVPYTSSTKNVVLGNYDFSVGNTDFFVNATNGKVGIGTTSPSGSIETQHLSPPIFSRNIAGSGEFTTPQSAIQIGLGGARPSGNGAGASFLMFANNDASEKIFLGRLTGIVENKIDGAERGALAFTTRTNAADTTAASEKMRITAAGNIGIGVSDPHSKLEVDGAISSATATLTASSDNYSVSGINILFVNIASNIILGGLTGGVNGQVLYVVYKGNYTSTLTAEDTEGVGDQNLYMHTRADEVIDGGGFTFVCNGSDWFDSSHARHV